MPRRPRSQRAIRLVMVALLLLVLAFVWLLRSTYRGATPGEETTFSEFSRSATSGLVTRATLLDRDGRIVGTRCVARAGGRPPAPPATPPTPASAPGAVACNATLSAFHADLPRNEAITQQLIQSITRGGAPLTVDRQHGKALAKVFLTSILPLAILATLSALILMVRGTGRSLADVAGLGTRSREQQRKEAAGADVTFADVAGADDAVATLREVSEYLVDPNKFQGFGGVVPRGVLLFGPPGCGKTLLARAVAGEAKVPFLSVSGSELAASAGGADRLRRVFEQAREVAPAVVFVDELDALSRPMEGASATETAPAFSQLLAEIDGLGATTGIVMIGATNRPEALDRLLLRQGRLDRHVAVSLPDLNGRKAILRLHAQKRLLARGLDFEALAARTTGLTGADLSEIIDRAAWSARQGGGEEITSDQISDASQLVHHGPQGGRLLGPDGRQRMAYHHAGHAVVSAAFAKLDQLERVSILGHSHFLGQPGPLQDRDGAVLTSEEMEGWLGIAMAGVAAEQLRFATTSTAAEADIEWASGLAREMVGRYGMSSKLGRVRTVDQDAGDLSTGTSFAKGSERTRQDFDDEVKRLITTAEQRATAVLQDHRAQLDKLAAQLTDAETLRGAPLQALLASVQDRTNLLRDGAVAPDGRRGAR